jgi:coenzyme PQQ precursor peptide PqqA
MSKPQDQKKKAWTKPTFKDVPIFFECTYYAAAAGKNSTHA